MSIQFCAFCSLEGASSEEPPFSKDGVALSCHKCGQSPAYTALLFASTITEHGLPPSASGRDKNSPGPREPTTVSIVKFNDEDDDYLFGEARVKGSLRPPRHGVHQVIFDEGSMITQGDKRIKFLMIFKKEQVIKCKYRRRDILASTLGALLPPPEWPLPPGTIQVGGLACDVWTCRVDLPGVSQALVAHAEETMDRPIPRYQMVIDPNLFVHKGQWVPSEFDISSNTPGECHARLVGASLSHPLASLVDKTATPVLSAALPLLSKLVRPALLLPGSRLQVVVKAQRIILPPAGEEQGDESEYVGLWHMDGDKEHIVAVVLYYHRVDDALEGGAIEFMSREPMDSIGWGDCWENADLVGPDTMKGALHRDDGFAIPNCKVPIEQGTLLVFSNYQMVHRVLRMVSRAKGREASRDFMALFIVDQAKPLLPARCKLAPLELMRRSLRGCSRRTPIDALNATTTAAEVPFFLGVRPIETVLQFLGLAGTADARRRNRNELLRSQLKPRGKFGSDMANVYSTGNGCFTMIGWLDSLLQDDGDSWSERRGWKWFEALNCVPKTLGRGASEKYGSDVDSEDILTDVQETLDTNFS